MGTRTNKRLVRSLMSRIRAYERFFKEKEKSQKESVQKGKKGQKGQKDQKDQQEKKAGGDTGEGAGVKGTDALEPNNQAHTAYVNLIKLVHNLEKDNPEEEEDMPAGLTEERVREVLRDVYGISTVSE